MKSCPNCGAPWNPYSYRCEYCGTYAFDTTAWDIEEDKPCYIKFKTSRGVITALARPIVETIETNYETNDVSDGYGNKLCSFVSSRNCDINVRFRCQEDIGSKSLIRMETNYG